MNSSLSRVLVEGKTQWNTTTSEFKELTEDNRSRIERYTPKHNYGFLKLKNETHKGFRHVIEILTNSLELSEFEDKTYQTLVKENLLKKGFPKFIPIQEAIAKIKEYKEETKKNIEKRDKEEYEKLENLPLDPFDV
jgi:hypothetical protein